MVLLPAVMEFSVIDISCVINNIIRKCTNTTFKKFYAGLAIYFILVPSTLSQSVWPKHLTYEHIYNNTRYPQLRHTPRPFTLNPRNTHGQAKTKGTDLGYNYVRTKNLLVGFAHDPFRYSVPEADYSKGVRVIEPPQYMNKTDRGKRGVVHLYNMLTCATGCNPISYKGYGCYCGIGGSGRPADGIDNCCRLHDECYENIHCPFYTVYFQPYYWTCYDGEPLCALENYQNRHQVINSCAGRLCECDRRFAMCVRQYTCPIGRPLCRSSPFRLLQNILLVP
ncbi:uncharacterized protein LOC119837567 [Zerene cesonia]|uniref:uncharacterized protein LOC119837567 n=1 Tax=Zerene cesonia TaxID=33412 RepID=UPI0018E59F96|nr:uncharacterized protein LOC119837567 [Zerene cesonia]